MRGARAAPLAQRQTLASAASCAILNYGRQPTLAQTNAASQGLSKSLAGIHDGGRAHAASLRRRFPASPQQHNDG